MSTKGLKRPFIEAPGWLYACIKKHPELTTAEIMKQGQSEGFTTGQLRQAREVIRHMFKLDVVVDANDRCHWVIEEPEHEGV